MQDVIENAVDIATSPSVPRPAADEKALRVQLANFYHLVDYFGWTEMIFNHISVRLPGPEGHYLVAVTPDDHPAAARAMG